MTGYFNAVSGRPHGKFREVNKMKKLLTAESVCAGHPDKLCDYIADSILDACLENDPMSRVACEVMATVGKIFVAGEITCSKEPCYREIILKALEERGYDPAEFDPEIFIHTQSPDIAGGVDSAIEFREGKEEKETLGAGDQGTAIGYATNETKEMLPLPLLLSHKMCRRVDECREKGIIKELKPDGKGQVSVEYEDGRPVRIKTVVLSVQHSEEASIEKLKKDIYDNVLVPAFKDFPMDSETEILINPSGRFVVGGPAGDTGLTGRKLMVDTYGGLAGHGGGAFSGKDATKVDRSAAYYARFMAKNAVAAGLCDRCEVAVSYAIGKADPVAISVNTFGTEKVPQEEIEKYMKDNFNPRPENIIKELKLREPVFKRTASYGHFSSPDYEWEKIR